MDRKDIIVIGASAGGVEALCELCAALPADLPASVFVVQHVSPNARSMMAQVLARESRLPVTTAVDGQEIRPGHIYTAVPDHHLLLRPGRMMLRRGPQENRSRPAIDALFRSAAVAYGPRVIGVVLTGQLDDGTEGLICITAAGGTSVVQSPEDAAWPSMPRNA
ncbi:MAG TPA: chemotaxis protein CheB, partial [Acetobacteraceae bacterium]